MPCSRLAQDYGSKRGQRAGIRVGLRLALHGPAVPSVILANIHSPVNKMDNVRSRVTNNHLDICITVFRETWLHEKLPELAVELAVAPFTVQAAQVTPVRQEQERHGTEITRQGGDGRAREGKGHPTQRHQISKAGIQATIEDNFNENNPCVMCQSSHLH
ncbi:unnamed protein product [Leuciscus chuanchicus]